MVALSVIMNVSGLLESHFVKPYEDKGKKKSFTMLDIETIDICWKTSVQYIELKCRDRHRDSCHTCMQKQIKTTANTGFCGYCYSIATKVIKDHITSDLS